MVEKLKSIITAGWFLTLVGLILVGHVVWFIGPLIEIAGVAFLAGAVTRLLVIMVMLLVWGGYNLWKARAAQKANEQFVADLSDGDVEPDTSEQDLRLKASIEQESEDLSQRLDEALTKLKDTRLGKKGDYLYQLPWYAVIGPPAAGKTTALINSGLSFPLSADGEARSIRGAGGTRRCDWWFTNDAVLIDTAGRYTVQDSNKEQDAAAWLSFLDTLKQRRSRRPLNGLIVAIAASDMLGDAAKLQQHSEAIRQRINEVNDRLGIVLPTYLMVTKMDLLSGFSEFFDDLNEQERREVWGVTFPADTKNTASALADFDRNQTDLSRRLEARVSQRLQSENDLGRRGRIFAFPQQFAELRAATQRFLEVTFTENRYTKPPLLRGVYFTCGTQEGAPIDRLLGSLSKGLRVDGSRGAIGRATGKSFFINRLLQDVIFQEASLAGVDPKTERAQRQRHWAAVAAGAAVLAIALGLWARSFVAHGPLLAQLEQSSGAYASKIQSAVQAAPDVTPADLVPALNELRDAPFAATAPVSVRSAGFGLGLDQKRKVRGRLNAKYRTGLQEGLQPAVLAELAGQLRDNQNDPYALFEILRVYLMAGGQGPLDADAVVGWLAAGWSAQFPGGAREQLRADLIDHSKALFSGPVPPQVLDAVLIADARKRIRRLPASALAFSQLQIDPDIRSLTDWSVFDHAGPEANISFRMAEGAAVGASVPGYYTRDGYFDVVKARIADIANATVSDNWVLGAEGADISGADPDALHADIEKLYFAGFVDAWGDYFESLELAMPACGAGDGGVSAGSACIRANADLIATVTSATAPLSTFLSSAAQATDLRPSEEAENLIDAAAKMNSRVARARSTAARLSQGAGEQVPVDFAVATFEPIRELVNAPEGGASRLDRALSLLAEYGVKLDDAADEYEDGAAKAAVRDAASSLERTVANFPEPARRLLLGFIGASSSVVSQQSRQQLAGELQTAVASRCAAAAAGRFPFDRSAEEGLLLGDFQSLFGPSGVYDVFFDENLRRYAVTTSRRWSLTDEGREIGLNAGLLRQFQTAKEIQRAYFQGGALGASYTLEPLSLDRTANRVRLTVDGAVLEYAHTPPRPVAFAWPGAPGEQGARIVFDKASGGQAAQSWSGEWGIFRMLNKANIVESNRSEVIFEMSLEGLTARFALRANSVDNPFSSNAISQLSCARGL